MNSFAFRLHTRCQQFGTSALVGLDPRWDQLPEELRERAADQSGDRFQQQAWAFETFCCELIDIVSPLVPAVKPQIAFFEQLGPAGLTAVRNVILHARKTGLVVIADAKRGDIGSTAEAYASAWMAGEDPSAAPFAADALTVNAYLGADTLQPFVTTATSRAAGIYVLVRTSNPGAAVFQDRESEGTKLFETVADTVQRLNTENWSDENYGSIGAVVGATWPQELQDLRKRMPNTPLLVPGYGSQGGTASDVAGAFDEQKLGAVINSSRAINFAYNRDEYREQYAPERWREAITAATQQMVRDLDT